MLFRCAAPPCESNRGVLYGVAAWMLGGIAARFDRRRKKECYGFNLTNRLCVRTDIETALIRLDVALLEEML